MYRSILPLSPLRLLRWGPARRGRSGSVQWSDSFAPLHFRTIMMFSTFPQTSFQDSRVDSGSVDLGTPLELSPKSPLEALDEALDAVSQLRKWKWHPSIEKWKWLWRWKERKWHQFQHFQVMPSLGQVGQVDRDAGPQTSGIPGDRCEYNPLVGCGCVWLWTQQLPR